MGSRNASLKAANSVSISLAKSFSSSIFPWKDEIVSKRARRTSFTMKSCNHECYLWIKKRKQSNHVPKTNVNHSWKDIAAKALVWYLLLTRIYLDVHILIDWLKPLNPIISPCAFHPALVSSDLFQFFLDPTPTELKISEFQTPSKFKHSPPLFLLPP